MAKAATNLRRGTYTKGLTVRPERSKPRFAWHGDAKKRLLLALFDDFSTIYKSLFQLPYNSCFLRELVEVWTVKPFMVRQAHHELLNLKLSRFKLVAAKASSPDGRSEIRVFVSAISRIAQQGGYRQACFNSTVFPTIFAETIRE